MLTPKPKTHKALVKFDHLNTRAISNTNTTVMTKAASVIKTTATAVIYYWLDILYISATAHWIVGQKSILKGVYCNGHIPLERLAQGTARAISHLLYFTDDALSAG